MCGDLLFGFGKQCGQAAPQAFAFALIEHLIFINVSMMDYYLPGLMKVLFGDASPEDAKAEIDIEVPDDVQLS